MQSSNPVFRRSETFNGSQNAYGNPTYPGAQGSQGYGDPSTWSVGSPGQPGQAPAQEVDTRRITIDSVVQKTAITLLTVVIAAAATWMFIGDIDSTDKLGLVNGLAIGGALLGFGLAMVNSFKRVISPPLVIAYALVEGVFIGAFSTTVAQWVGDASIVFGAVLGTAAAFAGTLAAYKIFNIQVGARFRKIVIGSVMGFVALSFLDLILHFFGSGFGFNGFGTLGLVTSIIGVVLGVFMLVLDFDFVEKAIAAGAPERESWRAAFGLTVTLIWIYIELLRILAILRGDS